MKYLGTHMHEIAAAGVVVLSVIIGFVARKFLLSKLTRLAERTAWKGDDALVASLRKPLPL